MNGNVSRFDSPRAVAAAAAILLAVAACPRPAGAAGMLIADGGLGGVLEIQEHSVRVTVNNGIAVTEVTQVFLNKESRQVEALYAFPVPKDASLAGFSMWINGKEMVGEAVEKQRARQIYESYKPARRDPGLLEQADYKTFEMRIFPIAAGAQQKVQVRYYQQLDVDHDWATYVYPLAARPRGRVDSTAAVRLSFRLEARSQGPIAAAESPSHPKDMVLTRSDETHLLASMETARADLNKDVVVAYQLSRPRTGVDLIASRQAGEDGYLCLTLTAGKELDANAQPMDYVFVLDCSGSMSGDGKLGLSRGSILSFVRELGPEDRFEVLTFNTEVRAMLHSLAAPDANALARADQFLGALSPAGGTLLKPAIQAAYRYAREGRTLNVVILSDGMADQDDRAALIEMIRSRPKGSCVFCIGVGNDVNRPLLEQLAQDSGGLASFLSADDKLDRQARAFRRKLLHPAAADLRIEFAGGDVYDVQPGNLPNLYHGSPVRLYARYRSPGKAAAVVRAKIAGQDVEQSFGLVLPEIDAANPEVERMWAARKVDALLRRIDAGDDKDAVAEVVRLGEAFSIATAYTSFIVLENDAEYQRWKIRQANVLRTARDRQSNEQRLKEFEAIRSKAAANIGPPADAPDQPPTAVSAAPAPAPSQPPTGWRPTGGGPVDPLSIAVVGLLAAAGTWRRLRRRGPRP